MSEKLDGVRAFWNGTQLISRLGNRFFAPEWFVAGLPRAASASAASAPASSSASSSSSAHSTSPSSSSSSNSGANAGTDASGSGAVWLDGEIFGGRDSFQSTVGIAKTQDVNNELWKGVCRALCCVGPVLLSIVVTLDLCIPRCIYIFFIAFVWDLLADVKYHIFDVPSLNAPFEKRMQYLEGTD
jgi:hypothetical protein